MAEGKQDEELCQCSPDVSTAKGLPEEHIRRVEIRARMRWTCVLCSRPLLPHREYP